MRLKSTSFKILLFLILTITIDNFAFGQKLSQNAEISLLTCSPGDELYSLYGHSALRIKDTDNKLDIVFGYGTFNFNTPNFYTKFARGKLDYMLSYSPTDRFKQEYTDDKRGIVEQILKLDSIEKQQLFNALVSNYKPENRYYKYDFLFDNCSTRIRDIVKANINGELVFNTKVTTPKSFWNLLDPFMAKSRWIFLGIHLALGIPCDDLATPYQYMFLPDNMMDGFSEAKIIRGNIKTDLVESTKIILEPRIQLHTTVWYKRPVSVFGFITIIGLFLSLYYSTKKKNLFVLDTILFGASGLLGWVIIFLWFFTDHQATGPNWNIIWAFPLHFPLVFTLLRKRASLFSYYYFLLHMVVLGLILAIWPFFPQSFPNEILPFIVLLLIRSIYIIKKLRNKLI